MLVANPPIDKTGPSVDDVKEAVAKLRGGINNISAEVFEALVACCFDCCMVFR